MVDNGPNSDPDKTTAIVRFPQSRVNPVGSHQPFKNLGTSQYIAKLGVPDRQTTGHWCSKCRGIWFGYLLEVTCPVCGNRHG